MTDHFGMTQKRSTFNAETGARLQRLQEALGLKQGQFAKLLGMSSSGLANCQIGDNAPKPYKLLVLKSEYGVTLDYIYTGDRKGMPSWIKEALDGLVPVKPIAASHKARRKIA